MVPCLKLAIFVNIGQQLVFKDIKYCTKHPLIWEHERKKSQIVFGEYIIYIQLCFKCVNTAEKTWKSSYDVSVVLC